MRWPWVSRALYEHVNAQLQESEAERKELTAALIDLSREVAMVERQPQTQPAAVKAGQSDAYTTPIDSVIRRFGASTEKANPKFRARM